MTYDDLVGTWLLVSFELRKDNGEIIHPFGKDVAGRITYSAEGFFSAQVMKKDRALFESNDQMNGRVEEMMDSFKGVISYFGSYSINDDVIMHHIEESLFPNWKGQSMKRFAKLVNGILELSTEPTTWQGDNSIGMLIWRKANRP